MRTLHHDVCPSTNEKLKDSRSKGNMCCCCKEEDLDAVVGDMDVVISRLHMGHY